MEVDRIREQGAVQEVAAPRLSKKITAPVGRSTCSRPRAPMPSRRPHADSRYARPPNPCWTSTKPTRAGEHQRGQVRSAASDSGPRCPRPANEAADIEFSDRQRVLSVSGASPSEGRWLRCRPGAAGQTHRLLVAIWLLDSLSYRLLRF